ncbi:terpene cyclase/mutase family protein [Candidatus Micrarchaeota archaeon]|nr:terpene cyclase/mutase family protein [Candidatus Micrarchaeota archaeon]
MKKIWCGTAFLLVLLPFVVNAGVSESIQNATNWLKTNQDVNGTWGAWFEHHTALASVALYLVEGNSSNVSAGLSYLKTQLENPSAWFYGEWGEADVPGAALYAFPQTNYSINISVETVSSLLLLWRNSSNGGFKGYCTFNPQTYECPKTESSVDTAWALLGLLSTNSIDETNKTAALGFLLGLQNENGAFNLTNQVSSFSLYSLGPEPISLTALSLFALGSAGVNNANTTAAMNYLKNMSAGCFGNSNHSFATAMSVLAFLGYNETLFAGNASKYLMSLQKEDGGFVDFTRSNNSVSKPLDTAVALIALKKAENEGVFNLSITNITLANRIGNGTIQRISASIVGAIQSAIANISHPNATTYEELILSYNRATGRFENSTANTTYLGVYNVTVSAVSLFGNASNSTSNFTVALSDGCKCTSPSDCASPYCVRSFCRAEATSCGDAICEGDETSQSCPTDCVPYTPPSSSDGGASASQASQANTAISITVNPQSTTTSTTTTSTSTSSTTSTTSVPLLDQWEKERREFEKLLVDAKGIGADWVNADILMKNATSFKMQGNYSLALQYAREAVKMLKNSLNASSFSGQAPAPPTGFAATASFSLIDAEVVFIAVLFISALFFLRKRYSSI